MPGVVQDIDCLNMVVVFNISHPWTKDEYKFQVERKQRCTNRNIHTTVTLQEVQDSQTKLRVTDED